MAHVAPTPAPDQEVHSEEPPTGGVCHLPICVFTTTTFNVDFVETLFLCISVSVIVSIYKGLPCVKKFCSVPFSYFVSWSLHFHGCDGLDTFGTFNLNLHRPFREKGVNVWLLSVFTSTIAGFIIHSCLPQWFPCTMQWYTCLKHTTLCLPVWQGDLLTSVMPYTSQPFPMDTGSFSYI